jgi:hypothetical protein
VVHKLTSKNGLKNVKISINKAVTTYYRDKRGYNINRLHPALRLFIYTEFYQSPLSIPEIERNKKMLKVFTQQKLFKYKLNKRWLLFWELYKRHLWPDIYKKEEDI